MRVWFGIVSSRPTDPQHSAAAACSGRKSRSSLWPATLFANAQLQRNQEMQIWYWVIAVVALLWNLLGCAFFSMEIFAQESLMKSMTEDQKAWTRSIPAWIYFVYALAVSTGVAGSVGLFLRKDWAIVLFAICLVAVLVQMGYTMIIAGGLRRYGTIGSSHALVGHCHRRGPAGILMVRQ